MGYTYADFAEIYCCSERTIRRKALKLMPLFKNFEPKKRKRSFSHLEAQIIIQELGFPPQNSNNIKFLSLLSIQK